MGTSLRKAGMGRTLPEDPKKNFKGTKGEGEERLKKTWKEKDQVGEGSEKNYITKTL